VRQKRRWSVTYEGDLGSGWEWCQIKLHTSCDVPARRNQRNTTVVDDARSIFAPTVVVINESFEFTCTRYLVPAVVDCDTKISKRKSNKKSVFFILPLTSHPQSKDSQ
jgi:hypothetical protein